MIESEVLKESILNNVEVLKLTDVKTRTKKDLELLIEVLTDISNDYQDEISDKQYN